MAKYRPARTTTTVAAALETTPHFSRRQFLLTSLPEAVGKHVNDVNDTACFRPVRWRHRLAIGACGLGEAIRS
jgi:hypothetical protein